jgi:hypothetical protein
MDKTTWTSSIIIFLFYKWETMDKTTWTSSIKFFCFTNEKQDPLTSSFNFFSFKNEDQLIKYINFIFEKLFYEWELIDKISWLHLLTIEKQQIKYLDLSPSTKFFRPSMSAGPSSVFGLLVPLKTWKDILLLNWPDNLKPENKFDCLIDQICFQTVF